jgi:hypothetical protein
MNIGTCKTLGSPSYSLHAPLAPRIAARRFWQERFTARLEALVLLQTLNAELLSNDSATLTIDRCRAAGITCARQPKRGIRLKMLS